MLHHLALAPLAVVDGRFPSENHRKLSRPKIVSWGDWAKEIRVFPGNCPKKVPKMATVRKEEKTTGKGNSE